MPKGKFSQPAFGSFEAMAYVARDGVTEFVTESFYRARAFEWLPSQDEYEAAEEERRDIEADAAADAAFALHQFEFLSIAMGRFSEKSDAWRDFTVDCGERLNFSPDSGPTASSFPMISGNIGSQCRAGPMVTTTNLDTARQRSDLGSVGGGIER
jgi:hypothetical protein